MAFGGDKFDLFLKFSVALTDFNQLSLTPAILELRTAEHLNEVLHGNAEQEAMA